MPAGSQASYHNEGPGGIPRPGERLRTTLLVLIPCLLLAPAVSADAVEIPAPIPTPATGHEEDCVYVDPTYTPPRVWTAPC